MWTCENRQISAYPTCEVADWVVDESAKCEESGWTHPHGIHGHYMPPRGLAPCPFGMPVVASYLVP